MRIHYRCEIPGGSLERAQRALDVYAAGCPAYLSVRDCIAVSWTATFSPSD